MTNLTEKWKKGELPSGYYYVKNEFGNTFPSDYSEDYDYINDTVIKGFFTEVSEIKEILAPVPSYNEYQKLLSDQLAKNEGVEINAELEAENTKLKTENKWYSEQLNEAVKEIAKLKELLTMAKEVLKMVDTYSGDYDSINGFLIVEKINQVLGE